MKIIFEIIGEITEIITLTNQIGKEASVPKTSGL